MAYSANEMLKCPGQVSTYKAKEEEFCLGEAGGNQGRNSKINPSQVYKWSHVPKWLANVVLVRKTNGKWRVSVDFTDLNKACQKDSYPLPRIDQLVDSTTGHELLSFLDAY